MDLSPNDIRNYEFNTQMRGYDKEEVNNLLEQIAVALENSKQDNLRLSMEVESLKSQLAGLKQFEDTIKSAAIDARRNADMTIANAKQEADLILSKARGEAERTIASRSKDVADIESQITKLAMTKNSYLNKVKSMIKSHLELLDEVASGEIENKEFEDRLEVTETQDVTTDKRESLAAEPEMPEDADDEAEEMGDELSESSKNELTNALKGALKTDDEAPAEELGADSSKVDPELAAALEKYKHAPATEAAAPKAQAPAPTPAKTKPEDLVETNQRAEDIPHGFVTVSNDPTPPSADTDRVKTAQTDKTEHNAIDIEATEAKSQVEPADLAKELDNVVAKFEEEMDRAEKN